MNTFILLLIGKFLSLFFHLNVNLHEIIVLSTLAVVSNGFFFKASGRAGLSNLMNLMMVNPIRGGSVVALVTPMDKDNNIDYKTLQDLLRWHVKEGNE